MNKNKLQKISRLKQGGFLGSIFSGVKKAVGAVSSVLSPVQPLINTASSIYGGQQANQARLDAAHTAASFNQASTREQMDFQERMSNTAVQRRMKDLRKAGINPILAGQYEATSPQGGSAQMPYADQQDVYTPAINTGLQTQQTQGNINQIESQIEKVKAETTELTYQ